jgi:hypothetical protein
MKSLRFVLSVVLMSLFAVAFAQTDAQKPVAQSDAQKSFDKLKTLAGSWEGQVKTLPQTPMEGKPMQVSLRVTSRGNALMHEMQATGIPDDPITMFYVDEDRLLLTHYCDAGNRPRMVGKVSPDGKTMEFDFLDVANYSSKQGGHMKHAVFTFVDPNHHTEDWTFMLEGKQAMQAHLDLQRTK